MPQTAILLKSPPGCGKSEAARQAADKMGLQFYAFVAAQEDPCDTAGVIALNKDGVTSSRRVPLWWKNACDKPYLILCDELTACSPEQFAAVLRATDDSREICGQRLHDKTLIVAAMNPPEFAAGAARELSAPVLSRFRHRSITGKEAIDWMNGGPGIQLNFPIAQPEPTLTQLVAVYLRNNPGAALAREEEIKAAVEKQEPFACPRAWRRASVEEGDIQSWSEYIGTGAARGFIEWFGKQDLPSPVEILAGRIKTVPSRGDSVMATAASLVALLDAKCAEAALGHGMDWFRLAAEAGHVANAAPDLRNLIKVLGVNRISRYAKELKPYAAVLKLAGQL